MVWEFPSLTVSNKRRTVSRCLPFNSFGSTKVLVLFGLLYSNSFGVDYRIRKSSGGIKNENDRFEVCFSYDSC